MNAKIERQVELPARTRAAGAIGVAILHILFLLLLALGLGQRPSAKPANESHIVESFSVSVTTENVIEPKRGPVSRKASLPDSSSSALVKNPAMEPVVPIIADVDTVPTDSIIRANNDTRGPATDGSPGFGKGEAGGGSGTGAGMARPARKLSGYISSEDYPRSALAARAQGSTSVRIQIDPIGRVTRCEVFGSSSHAPLDTQVCTLVKNRYRFQPGTDARGQPTTVEQTETFTWILPVAR